MEWIFALDLISFLGSAVLVAKVDPSSMAEKIRYLVHIYFPLCNKDHRALYTQVVYILNIFPQFKIF